MYCIFCGNKIDIDSIFCCHCGKNQTSKKFENQHRIQSNKQSRNVSTYSSLESNSIKIENNYNKYYSPKRYILTLNELKLYKILLEITKEENLILLCQVSLYSIIETKNGINYGYFNKIRSKSIDFVLARNYDCKIELCIELDDSTHNLNSRISRDNFINELFNSLHINLLRIKTKSVYNKEELRQQIMKYIPEKD